MFIYLENVNVVEGEFGIFVFVKADHVYLLLFFLFSFFTFF